ncbi:ribonuclease catalytic domain-containing protein [Microseira wollei]|uniref:Exoribonuclease II n=1 Tax=Microseira wollei NIES-4236 TaxID=2530354 RepID=A0AAV3XGF5_9CYAN|nr:ribonuclease R family protein [Microseira wollei]GET39806.1 exoribonuclease II [Microseira wollei NIES-4236]
MEKGTLVEFRLHGERCLAVAERPEGKNHWIVVDDRGQARTINAKQVSYEVNGETYKPSDIPRFRKEVDPFIDPESLEVAWEFLVEEGLAVDPAEMAMLLFSEKSPAQCYAAYYLLSEDKLYFKQKGDRYEPRSTNQVAEIKHQLEVARERETQQKEFWARVEQALRGFQVEWQQSDRHRLEALERFAIQGDEATGRAAAVETLAALKRPENPQGAFDLLVDLGLWSRHENLFLRRSSIPVNFSTKVLEVAHQRTEVAPPDPDSERLDLTRLKVYTIDDESTKEIDDGLSWELIPDGKQRLWVHIADPTRWLTPGDELDLDARRRSTTLYLPTGMIPMFPAELATGPMSLVQGKICNALSFGIILDDDGAVSEYSIHASIIKPTYRLTYEDVDEMLQLGVPAELEIDAIARYAQRRQMWRRSQGAINIHLPEASIKVDADEIHIEVLEDSPSRQLVAEMMILAGEVAARYAQTHQLALPFRSQPQPELPPDEELLQLPAGPVRACAIRRCMPRSEMSITPARHASLGLDSYTQVTSPIRRYSDLLTHFQIKAHLRGEQPPFSAEEVKEVMIGVTTASQEASLVERQTQRYWALEYLRRTSEQAWQAVLLRWLREDERLGLILLEDLGLELPMQIKRSVALGERLDVRVSYVDPRSDAIRFQELIDQPAQPAAT